MVRGGGGGGSHVYVREEGGILIDCRKNTGMPT